MYFIDSGSGFETYEEAETEAKKYAARYSEDYKISKTVAIAKTPPTPEVEVITL